MTYTLYHSAGWVGFATIMLFNLSFLVLLIIDCCFCCTNNSRDIRNIRQQYFYEKIIRYEKGEDTEIVDEDVLDGWVVRGDLNEKWIDTAGNNAPSCLLIEKYHLSRMGKGFILEAEVVNKVKVGKQRAMKSRIKIIEELKGTARITKESSSALYRILKEAYQHYDPFEKTIGLTIRTEADVHCD